MIHKEKQNVKYFLRRLFLLAWPTKDSILFQHHRVLTFTAGLLHEDLAIFFLTAVTQAEITHMWSRLCGFSLFISLLSHMMEVTCSQTVVESSSWATSSSVVTWGFIHWLYCGSTCPTWRDINHGNADIGVNIQSSVSVFPSKFMKTHDEQLGDRQLLHCLMS